MKKMILNLLKKVFEMMGFKNVIFDYRQEYQLYGKKWQIPVIKNIGKSHGSFHEEYLFNHYKQILQNAETFIDIGANLGQTIIKIKTIQPQLNYYAFEPSIFCANYISNLIQINNLEKIDLFPIGLSNSSEVLDFFITAEHSQGNSIIKGIRKSDNLRKVNIPVFKFDSVSHKLNITENTVMKIDVEGAEFMVLEGMRDFLTKHQPLLVMEFLRISEQDTDYLNAEARERRLFNQDKCEAFFAEIGLKMYCLTMDGKLDFVEKIGFNTDEMRTNYLIAPANFDIKNLEK